MLHYALADLSDELGRPPPVDLFAGTSVGALNTGILAAYADDLPRAARNLAAFWRTITFDRIVNFGGRELADLTRVLLGRSPLPATLERLTARVRPKKAPLGGPHPPVAGLFDTAPLRRIVREEIPWARLQQNLASGAVRGIAMCATEVCTGTSIVFHQTSPEGEFRAGRDPNKEARQVAIGPDHALASAAIPFLFPSVQIKGVCYTDGALRQNAPLNPALRLGADRVLVVSVTQRPKIATHLARAGCRLNPFPGALFLLGKTVKVILTQTLDYELGRVENYNRLIEQGTAAYGDGFVDELNRIMGGVRNARYRPVCTCHVRPTQNLDQLAIQALKEAPNELRLPGIPGRFVSKLMSSEALAESELLSFLLFTPTYINKLLDLGYQDARACRDRLVQLYAD